MLGFGAISAVALGELPSTIVKAALVAAVSCISTGSAPLVFSTVPVTAGAVCTTTVPGVYLGPVPPTGILPLVAKSTAGVPTSVYTQIGDGRAITIVNHVYTPTRYIVTVQNASNIVYMTVDGGSTWTAQTIPGGVNVAAASLAYNPTNNLIMINCKTNFQPDTTYVSNDGVAWTQVAAAQQVAQIQQLWSGGTKFYTHSGVNPLFSSTDGNAWTSITIAELTSIRAVLETDGALLVSGSHNAIGGAKTIRSTDAGATWTVVFTHSFAFSVLRRGGGDTIVGLGGGPTIAQYFAYSHDGGVSWTYSSSPALDWVVSLVYCDGVFFAHGNLARYESYDQGVTWTYFADTFGDTSVRAAAGSWSNEMRVMQNAPTLTLKKLIRQGVTPLSVFPKIELKANLKAVASLPLIGLAPAETLANNPPHPGASAGTPLVTAAGTLLILNNYGCERSTDDGVTWTTISMPQSYNGTRGCINTATGTIIGTAGKFLMRSTDDGLTWTSTPQFTNFIGAVACGGGVIVRVDNTGAVHRSTDDGVTYVAVPAATLPTNNIYSGTYGAGSFVFTARNEPVYVSSDNGQTFTANTTGAALIYGDIIYGGGLFVYAASAGYSNFYTSPTALTGSWTARTVPSANYRLNYAGGLFVAISSSGYMTASVDGATWNGVTTVSVPGAAVDYGLFITNSSNQIIVFSNYNGVATDKARRYSMSYSVPLTTAVLTFIYSDVASVSTATGSLSVAQSIAGQLSAVSAVSAPLATATSAQILASAFCASTANAPLSIDFGSSLSVSTAVPAVTLTTDIRLEGALQNITSVSDPFTIRFTGALKTVSTAGTLSHTWAQVTQQSLGEYLAIDGNGNPYNIYTPSSVTYCRVTGLVVVGSGGLRAVSRDHGDTFAAIEEFNPAPGYIGLHGALEPIFGGDTGVGVMRFGSHFRGNAFYVADTPHCFVAVDHLNWVRKNLPSDIVNSGTFHRVAASAFWNGAFYCWGNFYSGASNGTIAGYKIYRSTDLGTTWTAHVVTGLPDSYTGIPASMYEYNGALYTTWMTGDQRAYTTDGVNWSVDVLQNTSPSNSMWSFVDIQWDGAAFVGHTNSNDFRYSFDNFQTASYFGEIDSTPWTVVYETLVSMGGNDYIKIVDVRESALAPTLRRVYATSDYGTTWTRQADTDAKYYDQYTTTTNPVMMQFTRTDGAKLMAVGNGSTMVSKLPPVYSATLVAHPPAALAATAQCAASVKVSQKFIRVTPLFTDTLSSQSIYKTFTGNELILATGTELRYTYGVQDFGAYGTAAYPTHVTFPSYLGYSAGVLTVGYYSTVVGYKQAKSTDGGRTWTNFVGVPPGWAPGTYYVTYTATDVYALYAAHNSAQMSISRSTDGGLTWGAPNAIPGEYVGSHGVTRLDSGRLVMQVSNNGISYPALIISDDFGVTWTMTSRMFGIVNATPQKLYLDGGYESTDGVSFMKVPTPTYALQTINNEYTRAFGGDVSQPLPIVHPPSGYETTTSRHHRYYTYSGYTRYDEEYGMVHTILLAASVSGSSSILLKNPDAWAISICTATASLTSANYFAGPDNAYVTATASAALYLGQLLNASVTCVSAGASNMTVNTGSSASVVCTSTSTASIITNITAQVTMLCDANTSGILMVRAILSGVTDGVSSSVADATGAVRLNSAIVAVATTTGLVTAVKPMEAGLLVAASSLANMAALVKLAAATQITAITSADMVAAINASGAATGATAAVGSLTTTKPCAAAVIAGSESSSDLQTYTSIEGVIRATTSAASTLNTDIRLAATVYGVSDAGPSAMFVGPITPLIIRGQSRIFIATDVRVAYTEVSTVRVHTSISTLSLRTDTVAVVSVPDTVAQKTSVVYSAIPVAFVSDKIIKGI